MAKKRRTAAQRAATQRMIAANKRRKRGGARRSTPRPARKTTARAASRRVRRNPAPRRRTRRVRRNVIGGRRMTMRTMQAQLFMPALHGTAGSLVVDGVFGALPLPENMKTGYARHGIKAVFAVLLAHLGSQFFRPATAINMGVGSLTVTGHEIGRELAAQFAPALPLDGLGMPLGAYVSGPGARPQLGYMNSAPVVGYDDMGSGMGAYVSGPGARPQLAGGMSEGSENGYSYY
jgi:hypothetical protein